jgi:hypothetical protein
MSKILLVASGGVGIGKSALLEFLYNSLKERGLNVAYSNQEEARSERNMSTSSLETLIVLNPDVELVEMHLENISGEYVITKESEMRLITTNEELVIGRDYWVRDKQNEYVTIAMCREHDHWKFLQLKNTVDRHWAMEVNSQALTNFDIIGPIPQMIEPNFYEYLK